MPPSVFCHRAAKIPTGIAARAAARRAADILFNASVCEPLLHIPKMTMRLIYPLADTRLLVVNLHAINFTGIGPFKRNSAKRRRTAEPALTAPSLWRVILTYGAKNAITNCF